MPKTSIVLAIGLTLVPWSVLATDRPQVFSTDNHASNLTADERNEFILRVSTAAATGMYRELFSGRENQLFGDGGTVYRSRDYNRHMHKNFGNSGDSSPHRTELAADIGMRTLNPGRAVEWLKVLRDNGLTIPFLWDPIHVEPMAGTDLFHSRAESVNPYGRESYLSQADHLLEMRDLVTGNLDLASFLDAFPQRSAGSEEEAIAIVGHFHDGFSRVLIQQSGVAKRDAAFKSFRDAFNQTNRRRYEVPRATAHDLGPAKRDPLQFSILQKPYELGPPNYLKYLLSAEQYSVEVTRAAAKRAYEAQRAAAAERRQIEGSRRGAERLHRDIDRMSTIREPRLPRGNQGVLVDPAPTRERESRVPNRHAPYNPLPENPPIDLLYD